MEIEPAEVMNEEADVLDPSSFPIPVTSNLERLSKAESSAEVLILINYLKIHIKKLESAVTRTYRTNSEVPSGAGETLSNTVVNGAHISKTNNTALSSPSYFTTPPGPSEPIPTAPWASSRNSIVLKKPARWSSGIVGRMNHLPSAPRVNWGYQ